MSFEYFRINIKLLFWSLKNYSDARLKTMNIRPSFGCISANLHVLSKGKRIYSDIDSVLAAWCKGVKPIINFFNIFN
jgi:hypothetical protein